MTDTRQDLFSPHADDFGPDERPTIPDAVKSESRPESRITPLVVGPGSRAAVPDGEAATESIPDKA